MKARSRCAAVVIGVVGMAVGPVPLAKAQNQDSSQQACVNTMNKNMEKLSRAEGKAIRKCIKDFSKGKGTSVQGCLDGVAKVAKAEAKTCSDEMRRCAGVTPDSARPTARR